MRLGAHTDVVRIFHHVILSAIQISYRLVKRNFRRSSHPRLQNLRGLFHFVGTLCIC
jgi:hypothetical protein